MSLITEGQRSILQHIDKSPKQFAGWMHTASIASLIRKNFAEVQYNETNIKLKITKAGRAVMNIHEAEYAPILKSTAQVRKEYV